MPEAIISAEAGRQLRLRAFGHLRQAGAVRDGFGDVRRLQILRLDQATDPWPVGMPVTKGSLAFQHRLIRLLGESCCRKKQHGKGRKAGKSDHTILQHSHLAPSRQNRRG
jgi:hypothetical protein